MADHTIQKLKCAELDATGMPVTEICRITGAPYKSVSKWRNQDPLYLKTRDHHREQFSADLRTGMNIIGNISFHYLIGVLSDPDYTKDQKMAALEIIFSRLPLQSETQTDNTSAVLSLLNKYGDQP